LLTRHVTFFTRVLKPSFYQNLSFHSPLQADLKFDNSVFGSHSGVVVFVSKTD